RLERRAGDAGRDHAAAPGVLLQYVRGLLLVADRHRSPSGHHGPQAGEVADPRTVAGRAVAGDARAGQPALSAHAKALLVAQPALEELLHRRRRRPQNLGAFFATPVPPARPRGGPGLAGAASRGLGRPRWHLSGDGELDPGDAPARVSG